MNCPHYIDGSCRLASDIAGVEVRPHETACAYCTNNTNPPQALNRVVVSIAMTTVRGDLKKFNAIKASYAQYLPQPPSNTDRLDAIMKGHGPGSQLWKLLSELGQEHDPTCDCIGYAEGMNRAGVKGCRAKIWEIAGHIRDEAVKAGFKRRLKAVLRAGKTRLPINPMRPYYSIVQIAIKRAEQWDAAHGKDVG